MSTTASVVVLTLLGSVLSGLVPPSAQASTTSVPVSRALAGQVTAWGDNISGQASPPASLNQQSVVAVTGGLDRSPALTSDGQVVAWGRSDRATVPAMNGHIVTAIAGGPHHLLAITAALRADHAPFVGGVARTGGELTAVAGTYNATPETLSYAWKADGVTVGTDSAIYRPTVTDIDKDITVTVTASKTGYADSVTTSAPTRPVWGGGVLTGWGRNSEGQSTPPASLAGKSVIATAAGVQHSVALTTDGRVTGWGANGNSVPASLTGKTVTAIAAGLLHSVALTTDGKVSAWGYNIDGQTAVPAGLADKTVTAIAAGYYHSLALTNDGRITVWGDNNQGQTNVPTSLADKKVVAIAAGLYHSVALTSDGQITAWGGNVFGQTVVPTSLADKTVTAIAASGFHSLALTSDGQVTAWGRANEGQTSVPANLSGQTVTAIAAGGSHSLALTADDQIVIWGSNTFGQTSVPDSLVGKNITAVTAGQDHNLVLTPAVTATAAPVVSGTVRVGETLTATAGDHSPAGGLAVTYQWAADDTPISGATSSELALTPALRGKSITVTSTAAKTGYLSATSTSDATVPVAAGSFTAGPDAAISGTPTVGATLTADPGPADLTTTTPTAESFTYAWSADKEPIPGATGHTLAVTPALLDQKITVAVTAHRNGYTDATDTSDPVGPVAKASFTTGPSASVTGEAVVGGTLTADPGPADLTTTTPTAESFTYAWSADKEPIPGASDATLTLTAAETGKTVTVTVTAHRNGYTDASNTSTATAPVTKAAFTTGPHARISGDPVVGNTLTATPGPTQTDTTTPNADGFTYQWAADGDLLADATASTLELTPAVVGKAITVTVTATRSGYDDAADESDPTATVAKAPQAITFTAPTGVSFGDSDVTLGATSSSDLAVSYASTTPAVCTIVDGTLHVVGAGDCTVQADQAGDSRFAPASQVERTFAIGKAAQSIDFTAPERMRVGDADVDLGATASSGLDVTYTSSTPRVCTIVDGTLHAVAAGDCTVLADQDGNADYSAAPQVDRTFSIGAALGSAPTITGDTKAAGVKGRRFTYTPKVTGDPAPTVTLDGTALPAGLRLNASTGRITGTPTVVGAFQITLKATNGVGAADTVDVKITIATNHVLGLTPKITGTLREGRTLTAHSGSVAPGGATLSYRWSADGRRVRGATGRTLTLRKAQAGRRIAVTITARSPGRIKQKATSAASAVVSSNRKRLVLSTYTVRPPSRLGVVATGLKPRQKYIVWLGGVASYRGRADQHGTVRRSVKFSNRIASGNRRVRVSGYTAGKRTFTTYTTVRYVKR